MKIGTWYPSKVLRDHRTGKSIMLQWTKNSAAVRRMGARSAQRLLRMITNDDLCNLLADARFEIEQLRRRNEILSAKVEVFDSMMQMLHTRPAERPQACAPDVAFELQKLIEGLREQAFQNNKDAELVSAQQPRPDRDQP